jgi:hypothetical protein
MQRDLSAWAGPFFSISFERMSKYNLIRGEAFIGGECISVIEDSGFTNVEQVITKLLLSLSDEIEVWSRFR